MAEADKAESHPDGSDRPVTASIYPQGWGGVPPGRLSHGARVSRNGPPSTPCFSWLSSEQSRLGPSSSAKASHAIPAWAQKPEKTKIHFKYICQYFKEKWVRWGH